jgi:hypothetical protein
VKKIVNLIPIFLVSISALMLLALFFFGPPNRWGELFSKPSPTDVVAQARLKEQEDERIIDQGDGLGLMCLLRIEECAEFIDRAEKNPRLMSALRTVHASGVRVAPNRRQLGVMNRGAVGRVESGFITINLNATDDEIIEFLES